MLVRADGVVQPDVRLTLKTDDGQLIFVRYGGMRHGSPEVMERLARGDATDLELGDERGFRGERTARLEFAGFDLPTQLAGELFVERDG